VREHRQAPFDVVVGRYLDAASYIAVYAARFLGVPSVVSARGNDVDRGAFDGSALSQLLWTVSHASAVTAVSHELGRKLRALVPTMEPLVVHNGVDTDLFSPGPRAAPRPQVLFVGEARKKKGLPVLLEAHARVAANRDVELVLVGGIRGEDAEILQVFTGQNPRVAVRVLPAVPQAELVHHYRSAALLVMPSLHDGLPNALLEAMACACPVVATSVGGIPDVVDDEVEGLLVPPGDVTALAHALERVLDAPADSAERAARARRRVLRDFSAERERLTDLRLLERLVNGREARPQ
jgi:glycosyltransferase involved in cell wall biosynthesis